MVNFLAVFHTLLIFVFAWRIYRKQTALQKLFWPALAIKLIAGICLGLVYTYYYTVADTFVYFEDASRLADLARQDLSRYLELLFFNYHLETTILTFNDPRAIFLTKITSVFNLITLDHYWVAGFYFSFISFLAAWFLTRTIHRFIPSVSLAAAIAFLFFPSVVFWTSGLLKESLAMAALFFMTALFLKRWFGVKPVWWELILGVISLLVFWKLKYYNAAVFIPVVGTTLLYRFLIEKKLKGAQFLKVMVWFIIFCVPLALISVLHPNFYPDRILGVILTNNAAYNAFSDPANVVHFSDLRATPASLLKNAPWALFSGLFRPLFWETRSVIQFVPGVENTFLLILFAAASLRFKKFRTSPHRLLILTVGVYVILLCVLITISAPNFGTLSRYRVGYISFFIFIVGCDNPVLQYLERTFYRLVSH